MADIQELRRYLDDIKSGMQSINDLSLEIEEQSENLIGSIASFSGIGTKGVLFALLLLEQARERDYLTLHKGLLPLYWLLDILIKVKKKD